jgi:hypothetical protein
VLRKAINVGEAVSERLQAFVYEDVRTNRTMLTVRNVGSVGSEVEYLMAVGYDGNVLKEVRLNDTIKLGTQQVYTTHLSNLLGNEFNNYTDVRSRMAVLYLKTVKGGVFGSAYMAPPSVMTAAYATSTTTISTTETVIQEFYVQTGATAITTWEATVIIDNPMHWPVETYVGVAFPRHFEVSGEIAGLGLGWHYMSGFPAWGLEPGFYATDRQNQLREGGQRTYTCLEAWYAHSSTGAGCSSGSLGPTPYTGTVGWARPTSWWTRHPAERALSRECRCRG